MHLISPAALRAALLDSDEIALIDVREHGVYGSGHLLLASCIPLSRLELMVADLIPDRNTRVVLCDDGKAGEERKARMAAGILGKYGYHNVQILEGGTAAWAGAGYEIFSGVNVPSKAFGEFIEHHNDTPRITATELAKRQADGDDIVILDSRPMDEFQRMSIPGGVDCPGAELVYRVHAMAPDAATDVIVNCAGRTRSIIGCQSLLNAGIKNRVMALKDGTMGWHLAGLDVATGASTMASVPSGEALDRAKDAATHVASRFGVRYIDHDTLAVFQADRTRSLYLLDVRQPGEFQDGHLKSSRNAPGGQLIQATDEYIAVRNARVVLVDDESMVRATMTASWLLQMGWRDIYVLKDAFKGQTPETGPVTPKRLGYHPAELISVAELRAVLDSGESTAVVDFANSLQYRAGHIKGAWWAVRSRLATDLQFKPAVGMIVVTSPDGVLAHYAAHDIQALRPDTIVRVLDGGTDAWIQAGHPLEGGIDGDPSGKPDVNPDELDVFYKPYDFTSAAERRMQEYLDWEVALVEQIERDGTVDFRQFQPN